MVFHRLVFTLSWNPACVHKHQECVYCMPNGGAHAAWAGRVHVCVKESVRTAAPTSKREHAARAAHLAG